MRHGVMIYSAAVALLVAPLTLQASCGCASCPIDTHTAEASQKGWMRLDYPYEYSDQDRPRIGRHSADVGEIAGHHDEISALNQVQRLGLEGGITDRLSLGVSLPIVHREHEQRVNGIQLTSDANVVTGFSYRFSAI